MNEAGAGRWTGLTPRIPGSRLSAFRIELAPDTPISPSKAGEGDDVYLVERGSVCFEVEQDEHELGPGDSIHLRGGTAYRFVNCGSDDAALFQFSAYRRTVPGGHDA